ncbi:four-carbon acid sugar kinase family protein [Micromonospora sp. NPDC007230]|uniref:four-carbon acid sugar kinase family protein n=1 Tax=Micromonospora sp. NPDC007230 TaxID=3364237 RepID=UPI00368F183B
MPELTVVADDLSGAAEAAATFLLRTTRISVLLGHEPPPCGPADAATPPRVVAVDTATRALHPTDAADRIKSLLTGSPGGTVLKKVDSLLRGNLATEVAALHAVLGATPVVATALPGAGRIVVDGVLHVRGVPLHETGLWHAEERAAPRDLAAALAPLPTHPVPLTVVRGGPQDLARSLAAAIAAGLVPVCDAATDADLDTVCAAARLATERPLLVGSAGLAAAAARGMAPDPDHAADPTYAVPAAGAVLVVAGTAAPTIRTQLAALAPRADVVLRLDPEALLNDPAAAAHQVTARLDGARCAAVTIDDRAEIRPHVATRLATALAEAVAPSTMDGRALVLTGGETARAVLDRLGVARLRPVAEREGAVLSLTDTGRVVVTRPGSFGGPTSLTDLVRIVLSEHVT